MTIDPPQNGNVDVRPPQAASRPVDDEITACIALGGNQGDVPRTFSRALDALAAAPGVLRVTLSPLYSTAAVGGAAGERFINAVARVVCLRHEPTEPLALLSRLQEIEDRCGRVRNVRWGPRTLDLDLLTWGAACLDTPRLTLPHPRCDYRRFVLDPWHAVAPDTLHPRRRLTVDQLRQRLLPRPLPVILGGGLAEPALAAKLQVAFPETSIQVWTGFPPVGADAALCLWHGKHWPDEEVASQFIDLSEDPGNAGEAAANALSAALQQPDVFSG